MTKTVIERHYTHVGRPVQGPEGRGPRPQEASNRETSFAAFAEETLVFWRLPDGVGPESRAKPQYVPARAGVLRLLPRSIGGLYSPLRHSNYARGQRKRRRAAG